MVMTMRIYMMAVLVYMIKVVKRLRVLAIIGIMLYDRMLYSIVLRRLILLFVFKKAVLFNTTQNSTFILIIGAYTYV